MELYEQLARLVAEFDAAGIEYALCGGLAMAVHRLPRATIDIDLIIEPSSLDAAKHAAKNAGYDVDMGLMTFASGQILIHRLTKIDPEFGDVLPLDLLLVTSKLGPVWRSRIKVEWDAGDLWVVSREGLVALKRLRGGERPRTTSNASRRTVDVSGHVMPGRLQPTAARIPAQGTLFAPGKGRSSGAPGST